MRSPLRSSALRRRALRLVLLLAGSCGAEDATPASEAVSSEAVTPPNRVVLSDTAFLTAGIVVQEVRAPSGKESSEAGGLVVPGSVTLDPRRVAVVAPRVDVRVEELRVVEGDLVAAGAVMAIVSSPTFVAAQSELLQADRRAALLRTTADSQGGRALAEAAAQRLRLMGWTDAELSEVRRRGTPTPLLPVRATLGGSVLEAHARLGTTVAAGEPLFTVGDLSVVEVAAEVPEPSLPLVRVGQRATISFVAAPDRSFDGRVTRLEDHLDPESRTLRAIVQVRNGARILRPGMYASVRLALQNSGARAALQGVRVPASAVVMDGASRIVFVEVAERTFERREVRVASEAPAGTMQIASSELLIVEGLRAGERIVIKGAFTLKSELSKAAFGEED